MRYELNVIDPRELHRVPHYCSVCHRRIDFSRGDMAVRQQSGHCVTVACYCAACWRRDALNRHA